MSGKRYTNKEIMEKLDEMNLQTQKMSSEDKTDILIERYKESWNGIRLIHDMQWKSLTIIATIVTALMGLIVVHHSLVIALAPSSIVLILIGLAVIIKDREPFLKDIMIIARIEKLWGMHDVFPQFADKLFLPKEFTEISKKTYEMYIEEQKWKKKTLFFILILFYIILAISVVVVSIMTNLPVLASIINSFQLPCR